jgi:predicted flavoprotein YhiN
VPLKTERGNRVFPVSEKASDIVRAMERFIRAGNTDIHLNCPVKGLIIENSAVKGVSLKNCDD